VPHPTIWIVIARSAQNEKAFAEPICATIASSADIANVCGGATSGFVGHFNSKTIMPFERLGRTNMTAEVLHIF
jgi:hypothetical protein